MSLVINRDAKDTLVKVDMDRARLFEAIAGLRNSFTNAGDRQPLSFESKRDKERRSSTRIPLQAPVHVAAAVVGGDNAVLLDSEIEGEVVDLSLPGVAFTHGEPFLHFYSAIRFDLPNKDSLCLLAQLCWTVREDVGMHRTGAEFIGVVAPA